MLFRPQCQSCQACQSIRIPVDFFRPNRSQQRVYRTNVNEVRLHIGTPSVTRAKLDLYDRFHAFQTDAKDWPAHPPADADAFADSFVNNPFPVEEWNYFVGNQLIGVGYVDVVPDGLSAIYFVYDPAVRPRSPGVWNVLNVIDQARQRRLPYAYLGYYVEGCRSMAYKATFAPNEVRCPDGVWRPFRK
jgi:arginine-tRNA-protein transferase